MSPLEAILEELEQQVEEVKDHFDVQNSIHVVDLQTLLIFIREIIRHMKCMLVLKIDSLETDVPFHHFAVVQNSSVVKCQ